MKKEISKELVFVSNYKEPLTLVEGGYGYYGALMGTSDGELIQCHTCGRLFKNLSAHIRWHDLTSHEYKEKYMLAYLTSLLSEVERERMARYMLERIKEEGWDKKDLSGFARKGIVARKRPQPELMLETMNKRGTCPDQVLAKIQEVAEKLGRKPSLDEFEKETGTQKYKHLIFKIFGSYNNAIKMLGFNPNPAPPKYTDGELLAYMKQFQKQHQRLPVKSDFLNGLLPSMGAYRNHFGSVSRAKFLSQHG